MAEKASTVNMLTTIKILILLCNKFCWSAASLDANEAGFSRRWHLVVFVCRANSMLP